MAHNPYARYDKAQLVELMRARDEEIASLKALNRETGVRLMDVEKSLQALCDRLGALDQHDTVLRERHHDLKSQLRTLEQKLDATSTTKLALEARVADVEKELEHELIWRRGFFATLGLRVSTKGAAATSHSTATAISAAERSGSLEVIEVKEPARSNGIEVGDEITSATMTVQRPMQTLRDYMRFVTDLAPDAIASLELVRKGKRQTIHFQPAVASFHGP